MSDEQHSKYINQGTNLYKYEFEYTLRESILLISIIIWINVYLLTAIIPNHKTLYAEITNAGINGFPDKENSHDNLINGIFLYTDEDSKIVDYIKNNYEAFDKLTGEWCCIYVSYGKCNNCR
ncbi:hypothetical protein [Okeania sp. SIO1I7]|uniref:hypothetical protein n=1 Tax=Okeania sp. SIO1I7 TaxID=2607772 RepID=UPI0013F835C0|nr:hypothetical protein [Okeania sp. SIO1I7]NET24876.1 hypothetical protein [Okeania sp. SIO1I7]